jgi:hypothetical protein
VGFFDRFRKTKPTAAPPPAGGPPSSNGSPPTLPAHGKIATYSVADAVGTLELEDGNTLRFGRSACKGFEPVVGASVIVEELAADRRRLRARVVKLDPADPTYDALLDQRDAEQGLPSRAGDPGGGSEFHPLHSGPGEVVATARELGLVTILLRDDLPSGHQAVAAWAAARGFPRDGFEVRGERDLEFVLPGAGLITYVGRVPFPREGLDMSHLANGFDVGQSFVGLAGLPDAAHQERAIRGDTFDPWAARGSLRQVSRLVSILADAAIAVILHRAGDLVVPIDSFVRMLGELDDPDCIPFAAWLDVAITRRGDRSLYATFGMAAFGLPDVLTTVDADDRWSRSRRHEAVLYACYSMIRTNRMLRPGDTFAVPVRLSIGAWQLEIPDGAAAITYDVVERDGSLELVVAHEPAVDGAIAPNVYQALFDRGLAELVPSHIVRDVPAKPPEPIPHNLEVRARDDGRGFLVVTNGFGRAAGFEIAVWVPRDTFLPVKLVGGLAALALAGSEPWNVGDTVAAPLDRLAIGGFVIADGGTVEVPRARSVQLLLLVPLTEADYAAVRGGGARAWLEANPPSDAAWVPFLDMLSD